MSKKMWNKIFKTKSSKSSKTLAANTNKINKRCSIYEEYQQLNATGNAVDGKKKQNSKSPNSNENTPPPTETSSETIKKIIANVEYASSATVAAANSNNSTGNIHTQQKSQSTFSKVVNTLTLKRQSKEQQQQKDSNGIIDSSCNISKDNSSNIGKKQTKANKLAAEKNCTTSNSELFSHVNTPRSMLLIVVNKLVCDARNVAANGNVANHQHCSNSAVVDHDDVQLTITNATNTATNLHAFEKNTQSYLRNEIIETKDISDTKGSIELNPCPICNRTFNPKTLQKHVGICEKMAKKKRNTFDSSRQRRAGTELASYPLPKDHGLPPLRQNRGQSPKPAQVVTSPILPRKKLTEDVDERTTVRKLKSTTSLSLVAQTPETGKTVKGKLSTMLSAPEPTGAQNSSNFNRDRMRSSERSLAKRGLQQPPSEKCPHCERCFGIKAYDRHVEWCKEKALQASIKMTVKNEQNVAKERWEARSKYRAPCLKTKRSINRDKYSGLNGDEIDTCDSPKSGSSNTNNNNIMSLSMTSSTMSDTALTNHGNKLNGAQNQSINNKKEGEVVGAVGEVESEVRGGSKKNIPPANCPFDDLPIPVLANKVAHHTRSEPDFHLSGSGAKCHAKSTSRNSEDAAVERVVDNRKKSVMNKDFVKGIIQFIAPPKRTASNTSMQSRKLLAGGKNHQDQQQKNKTGADDDINDTTKGIPTLTFTNSTTSLNIQKLKTKQKSAVNLTMATMQIFDLENLSVGANDSGAGVATVTAALTTEFVTNNEINNNNNKKLRASKSLPQMQLSQQQQEPLHKQQQSIFEMPATNKKSTAGIKANISPTLTLTKLETNSIKAPVICRPKRKKLQRQQSIAVAPLKATIPLLKESIESLGLLAGRGKTIMDNKSDDLLSDCKDIRVIKAPPSPRTSTKAKCTPSPLPRDKSFILSGLSDTKYDPFLSAKRQLEDLCSPTSSATYTASPKTPNTPITPIVPQTTPSTPMPMHLNPKMTSSLYIQPSNGSPTSLTPTSLMNRSVNVSAVNTVNANKSSFRRTASLRGPRRSPMLSSRPLFTQQQRPTIQRGLSDEGPISNNFLKPEEYDEMPVRSVCVNDYAITKSPRVVRRDTSTSNRKNSLKLNINPATVPAIPNDPQRSADGISTASKYLSKTDSLAAFLKYENELEKLPLLRTEREVAEKPSTVVQHSLPSTPGGTLTQSRDSPLITKELKDKSNALSKQNSAKNIIAEAQESLKRAEVAEVQVNTPTRLPTPIVNHNEPLNHSGNLGQVRLEPISKPGTPSFKPSTPQTCAKPSTAPMPKTVPERSLPLPTVSAPAVGAINLNAIFGDKKPRINGLAHAQVKERKISSSSNEFIDPKLINKCDNLPVGIEAGRAVKKPDSSPKSSSVSSGGSTTMTAPMPTLTPAAPISKLSMLLPLHYNEEEDVEIASPSMNQRSLSHTSSANSSTTPRCAAEPTASSQRSSCDGRNLLKRKMRLGRNQFLYDCSPEDADCCSADDEGNRSSMEFDEDHKFNVNQYRDTNAQPTAPATTFISPPTIPPLPIFDDFDFEEFLSSFENDDDQFPLFKDCREFLMNRTSNKQRSTMTSNSNNNNNSNNKASTNRDNNNVENTKNLTYQQFTPNPNKTTFTHFPFESVINRRYTNSILTPSSHTSSYTTPAAATSSKEESSTKDFTSSKYAELKSPISTENFASGPEDIKREIFISIETEQNDLGSHSQISPEVLRNLVTSGVGNHSRAHVEEVCDTTDNKFSKIDDDEPIAPATPVSGSSARSYFSAEQYPNIQLNNAKNLIQKMQDDFRQMGAEVGANVRQAVIKNVQEHTDKYVEENQRPAPGSARSEKLNEPTLTASMLPNIDNNADSDDMSSLDSYPMSSQSSRRGVASKMSADSAYGSLSRQRSSELATQRSLNRTRPSTANVTSTTQTVTEPKIDVATQHYKQQQQQLQQQQSNYKYATLKNRARQYGNDIGGDNSSSSGSDNSFPQNTNKLQQQQQQPQNANRSSSNNNNNNSNHRLYQQQPSATSHNYASHNSSSNMNNNIPFESPLSSPTAMTPTTLAATGALSNSSSSMTGSMKMSKFCHECGARFIIEQAKFCMDCGVKRIVL